MSQTSFVSPKKGQLTCRVCKKHHSPKDGDWFVHRTTRDQQVFLCKKCTIESKEEYTRAVPVR